MIKVIVSSILLLNISFSMVACSQKTNEKEMKLTAVKLVHALEAYDSTSIINLFERNKELNERRTEILNDCSFFNKIIKKYGRPEFDSLVLTKAENGANIISIVLMNKNDSLLRIKKSVLLIVFYPDQFLSNPKKFLYYSLITEPLYQKKNKILERPSIKAKGK